MAVQVPAAFGGAVVALLRFTENELVAYFFVIVFLIADAGTALALNYQGLVGIFFSSVFQLLNFPIPIYSYQVLICLAIYPVAKYLFTH